MKEEKIEKYLVGRVKFFGGEIRKLSWIGRRGAPDRLVGISYKNKEGIHFLIELKRPGKTPTAAQYREHDRLRDIGFVVVWANSKDQIDRILTHYFE